MQSSVKIELPEGRSQEEDLISLVYALEYLLQECWKRDLKLTSHFIGVASETCKDEMKKLACHRDGPTAGGSADEGAEAPRKRNLNS